MCRIPVGVAISLLSLVTICSLAIDRAAGRARCADH